MHSEDNNTPDLDRYRALLFEYADGELDGATHRAITDRLEQDEELAAEYAAIMDLKQRAEVWHDVAVPAWEPPAMPARSYSFDLSGFRDWFPTVASAAALVMVVAIYFKSPETVQPVLPTQTHSTQPVAYEAAEDPVLLETLLEASRDQRERELSSLVKLLKAEMDRRSIETEESLRYIIAHQIQEQQQLDELYERVEHIDMSDPEAEVPRLDGGKLQ